MDSLTVQEVSSLDFFQAGGSAQTTDDHSHHSAFEDIIGMTVFASQAVDDTVNFLREPLTSSLSNSSATNAISNLVIVGGKRPETRPLVKSVADYFQNLSLQPCVFETLGAVDYNIINPETVVVSLTELDKPIFKDANYSAANTFMCSLAAQRRRRGLAATALNVGAIIGAGYMERESSKALDLTVSKMALMHLSEQDYHQIFAEGIDAGRSDSGDEAELTTGLLDIPAADGPNAPRWHANPTFSSFIVHQVENAGANSGNEAVMSIKDQLNVCKSTHDVFTVVKRSTTTADDELMAMRSSDIGLDSLISVDIRSWFLKSLEVSIPVSKIMGNDTMEGLAELVAGQVPPNLLPETAASGTPTSTEAPATIPVKKVPQPGSTATSDEDSTGSSVGDSTESVSAGASGVSLDYGDLSFEFNEASTPYWSRYSYQGQGGTLSACHIPPYFKGNLEDPLLGLSADEAAQIFSRADALIHTGADTSHLKFYPAIKNANAGSTKELNSLCMARKIPIHFLSTVGVALLGSFESFPEISVADLSPPLNGSHGYIAAKWASERMLENLHKEHGVNVWIHRPSTIIREGEHAENAAAQVDWKNTLVAYMRKTKAVPACITSAVLLTLCPSTK
ncbi:hypothetical protein LY76DRAFT_639600 [Colletotrichum caudatum]|nr:hypothetical protein LY76DRAFT_639600 [Colletotrichum caudatum]